MSDFEVKTRAYFGGFFKYTQQDIYKINYAA